MAKKHRNQDSTPANIDTPEQQITHNRVAAEFHSGPLPHPAILREYDATSPGAAERIIQMAERQLSHRISLEQQEMSIVSRNSISGIVCALVIGVIAIAGGVYTTIVGNTNSGLWLSGFALASLVGVFIYGTRINREQ